MGDHLRKRRLDLGLRQSDVAGQMGVYASTVNTWENHHFDPNVRFMPKIIAFLGYDPAPCPPTTFPEQLKAFRIAAGLTPAAARQEARRPPGHNAEWERVEARPSTVFRERLKGLLGVSC